MAIGVNARTAFSLLFPPILDEFGWDRGVTAGAFSFGFLVSALLSPLVGRLMDRRGPRASRLAASRRTPSIEKGSTSVRSTARGHKITSRRSARSTTRTASSGGAGNGDQRLRAMPRTVGLTKGGALRMLSFVSVSNVKPARSMAASVCRVR